ncbi:HWE histidine kinase domain-containing protein [Methylobacterium sp. CM6244]
MLLSASMVKVVSNWLTGDSEMARAVRGHDWSATPLGPLELWPLSLRIASSMVLDHPLPMVLCWGSELIALYNDAYRPLLGKKPEALGRSFLEVWGEARATIAPQIERAFAGETIRLEDAPFTLERLGRPEEAFFNYTFSPVWDGMGRIVGVLNPAFETTEHVLAERRRAAHQEALRESEERQAFLLELSDALQPLAEAADIQQAASYLLGQHLGASRIMYAEVYGVGDDAEVIIRSQHVREGTRFPERFPYKMVSEGFADETFQANGRVIVSDVASDPRLREDVRHVWLAGGIAAQAAVPLIKNGRVVCAIGVHASRPREWSSAEITLIADVAERTWAAAERARAESAQRESEARFAQFAASSSDALWIRNARTLAMEYASPAIQTIYGVPPEALLGDPKHWAALIVPEDRDAALEHLERGRNGEAVTHEFRIVRVSDGAFRWIRNTDFPLYDEDGRIERVGGIAQDITEAKQSIKHHAILLAELQHRVRNLLAMIRSVTARTGDTADSVEDYRNRLEGRLRALARTQTLLTRTANAGVDLATLVREEIRGQAEHDDQYRLSGPELLLAPKAAEVLTLAVHELATNALKYGALAEPHGRVIIAWMVIYQSGEPWLRFDWDEDKGSGVPPPQRKGFGTELITRRVPYELHGRGSLAFEPTGVRCCLEFPLVRGDSILETDAVTLQTTIAGGELDMTGEANLAGARVLVVEDDYYLALDSQRALQQAGAVVLGPCPDERTALQVIEHDSPGYAVVDINLGHGASFTVASALQSKGIPFVFVTGYDDVVIPEAFSDVVRLRKPVELRQVVRAVAQKALDASS